MLPHKASSWQLSLVLIGTLLAVCALGVARSSGLKPGMLAPSAILALLLWLWHMHLRRSGCPWAVSVAPVFLAAWELSLRIGRAGTGSLLAGGVFVYLVIWIFCAYEREPGLQPLATLALLISAGILATPTIAIACAVLGISFFVRNHRTADSGPLGFGLLLFTPLALCVAAVAMLAFLRAESLGAGSLAATVRLVAHTGIRQVVSATVSTLTAMIRELLFPLAVLALRIGNRRAGAADLAFALVVLIAMLLGSAQWIGSDAQSIQVIGVGGAAALLTNAFSRQWPLTAPRFQPAC